MINHYIPRLLLRHFADGERVSTYHLETGRVERKKLRDCFSDVDIYDEELEKRFAVKLEGAFGNLLNNKLLHADTITLNRKENLLLRKFLMIQFLRSPIINMDWAEMVKKTRTEDHPVVQAGEFLLRNMPGWKAEWEAAIPSPANYIENLKKAMELDSLEDLVSGKEELGVSLSLQNAARMAMMPVIAFWDTTESGQELILPKLPGISEMDCVSVFHKTQILQARKKELEDEWLPDDLEPRLKQMEISSLLISDNYSVYPISPTRCISCFSPYFKAFFPIPSAANPRISYPPLLKKEQFDRHFFVPPRMELFKPCKTYQNQEYSYQVKQLTEEELVHINGLLLNMETEEFVFHDLHKIRNSLLHYDRQMVFAHKKKHDFRKLY